ncbi:MAG: hypothetical protein HY000_34580 [Planctomycetes bacterium]|nr:hypothetical protein [Planctomycetota bacterium]
MNELMMLRQLMGSSGWLEVVFLLGMFGFVLFRRDSITAPGRFRLAYILFAMSILLPALLTPALGGVGGMTGRMFAGRSNTLQSDVGFVTGLVVYGSGPILFAFSVIFAFSSLMPRKALFTEPPPPVKHPLD